MLDSVCSTRSAPTVRSGPCSMNEPVSGRLSDAPPMPTQYLARLDDPPAGPARERDLIGMHPEPHPACLTRLERNPDEARQPAQRPRHRRHRVAEVELHHLGARPRPGVADRAGDFRPAIGGHVFRRHGQVIVAEAGVRQAVPEREQWRRIHRASAVRAGEPGPEIGRRRGGVRTRHFDGQLAAGHDPSGQHACDRPATLLAGKEGLHDPGQPVGYDSERVGSAGDQHRDHRGPGVGQRQEQILLGARQAQAGNVAALAGRAAPEHPGLVPDHGDHDLRRLGSGDRCGETRDVPATARRSRARSSPSPVLRPVPRPRPLVRSEERTATW